MTDSSRPYVLVCDCTVVSRWPSDISSASVVNASSWLAFWCLSIFSLPSSTAVFSVFAECGSVVRRDWSALRLSRRSCTCRIISNRIVYWEYCSFTAGLKIKLIRNKINILWKETQEKHKSSYWDVWLFQRISKSDKRMKKWKNGRLLWRLTWSELEAFKWLSDLNEAVSFLN